MGCTHDIISSRNQTNLWMLGDSTGKMGEIMLSVKDFESRGRWIQGQGGEGVLIDLDDFEEMEYSDRIVNLCHVGLGKYEVEDDEGNHGYFYPVDMVV